MKWSSKIKLYAQSIKAKFFFLFIIIFLPAIFLAIHSNLYSVNLVQTQVMTSNKNALSLYMSSIDRELRNTSINLASLVLRKESYQKVAERRETIEDVNDISVINRDLSYVIELCENVDSLFYYSKSSDDFLTSTNEKTTVSERQEIQNYLIDYINSANSDEMNKSSAWFPIQINDQFYLVLILHQEDIYVGAWLCPQDLKKPLLALEENINGVISFSNLQNKPITDMTFFEQHNIVLPDKIEAYQKAYQIVEADQEFLVTSTSSEVGDFSIVHVVMRRFIVRGLEKSKFLIVLLSFIFVFIAPLISLILWRKIFVPIEALKNGMLEVKQGNINVSLPRPKEWTELTAVTNTFNEMIEEIQHLKISVYEEQLQKGQAKIQYLHMQIKPHFFLNSLNIIYSLALDEKYELVMEMTEYLMDYFRYMFKNVDEMVMIHEEIRHIQNYLRIQELRYTSKFNVKFDIDPSLLYVYLPNLVIHTLVENIIKHAYSSQKINYVEIDISKHDMNNMSIVIKDNGPGFNEQALKEANALPVSNYRETHVGILNIKQRLTLIYNDKASIMFSNDEINGGAIVKISIPIAEGGIHQDECIDG